MDMIRTLPANPSDPSDSTLLSLLSNSEATMVYHCHSIERQVNRDTSTSLGTTLLQSGSSQDMECVLENMTNVTHYPWNTNQTLATQHLVANLLHELAHAQKGNAISLKAKLSNETHACYNEFKAMRIMGLTGQNNLVNYFSGAASIDPGSDVAKTFSALSTWITKSSGYGNYYPELHLVFIHYVPLAGEG